MKVEKSLPRGKPKKRVRVVVSLLLPALTSLLLAYFFLGDPARLPRKGESQRRPPDRNQTIDHPKIGLLTHLSGPFRREGEMLKLGVELAWKELADRGIDGELIIHDGAKESSQTYETAAALASDPHTLAVIAHLPVAALSEIIPIYERENLLILAPAGSHQNLVGQSSVIPLVYSDRTEGAHAATIAKEWAKEGVAGVLFDSTPYGELLLEGFQQRAAEIHLKVSAVNCSAEMSIAETIEQLLAMNPPVVWLAGSPLWGARIINAALEQEFTGRFLAPQTYGEMLIEDLFAQVLDRLYVLRPIVISDAGNKAMQDFREKFRETYWQDPNWLAVLGYDAMGWLGKTMEKGSFTRRKIRKRLLRYNSPQRAYQGVGGPVYLDENGHLQRPFHIAVFRNGKFVPLENVLDAKGTAVPN